MNVLVVDDSRAMRALICRMLRLLGYTTLQAADGLEALEVLHGDAEVDVVLLDWNMPRMSGIEFLRALRQEEEGGDKHLPVLMVTSESELERVAEALESGVDEYLMKPFTGEQLASKLEFLETADS